MSSPLRVRRRAARSTADVPESRSAQDARARDPEVLSPGLVLVCRDDPLEHQCLGQADQRAADATRTPASQPASNPAAVASTTTISGSRHTGVGSPEPRSRSERDSLAAIARRTERGPSHASSSATAASWPAVFSGSRWAWALTASSTIVPMAPHSASPSPSTRRRSR